jgi:hypothetical protein
MSLSSFVVSVNSNDPGSGAVSNKPTILGIAEYLEFVLRLMFPKNILVTFRKPDVSPSPGRKVERHYSSGSVRKS